MRTFIHVGKVTCVALAATLLASCGGADTAKEPAAAGSKGMEQSIHSALPQSFRDDGVMKVVISGPNPPWWVTTPGKEGDYEGAGAELMDAVGEIMGVDVEIVAVPDISGAFAAISAKRYAFGFFPYADSVGGPRERPGAEFVDVLQEVVPFLVKAGNPKGITSMDTLCGVTVAALVNAATYKVASAQAEKCRTNGKDLKVLGVKSVPDGILALKSGRADTFFTGGASLFHAAKTSNGEFEVVGEDAGNGFGQQFMGALLPKGSDLTQPLLRSFQKLFDDGRYETIMRKWGLDAEIIDEPGVNLYSKWLAEHPAK
jgi:polar amino acid transport system substrate-binding protein